ncbi:MAG: hypothetical protein ABIJ11_05310 [Elusimicrobiota bacterium]
MDEFKELDDELKKLEDEYSATGGDDLHELIVPTATDYWKRRVDDDKSTWTKLLETKEKEKDAVEQKLGKAEAEVKSLHEKIKSFDKRLAEELAQWQEKFRSKEIEFEVSRERINFIDKIKDLERGNTSLQEKISVAKKESEEKLNEFISSQDALLENLSSIENDLHILETELNSYREKNQLQEQKILSSTENKNVAENENKTLRTKLAEKIIENEKHTQNIYNHISSVIDYYTGGIKEAAGTLLGVVEFCYRRVAKLGAGVFFMEKFGIKKQLVIVETVISEMIEHLRKMAVAVSSPQLSTQDVSMDRFLSKISEEINTSAIPERMKVSVDLPAFLGALKYWTEEATSISVRYVEGKTSGGVEMKIVIPGKTVNDEKYLELSRVVCAHGWSVAMGRHEERPAIFIYIS